jgi:hypothetical protein
MISPDVFHVAAMPPAALDPAVLAKAAQIVGRDPYTTRLLLVGKMPKLLAHCHTVDEAQEIVSRFKALGLSAFVCPESFLRTPLPAAFSVRAVRTADGLVLFRDSHGTEKAFKPDDIFLILKGRMQQDIATETIKTKMKFSVGKTLMTGGIPMFSKVEEKSKGTTTEVELFARLYVRGAPEPQAELSQHGVDYSFLKEKLNANSFINFSTAINELRLYFPRAAFDDRLAAIVSSLETTAPSPADTETNARLLYLYYDSVA